MNAKSSKTVYILGAGFSKAVSRWMPLTNELGREISESYVRRSELPHDLKAQLEGNFEAVLTALARKSLYCESSHLLYSDFTDCVRAIIHRKARAPEVWPSDTPPLWLDALVEFWRANATTVICLNYDTIVERVASGQYNGFRDTPIPTTASMYGVPLKRADLSGEPEAPACFRLLKVHGSINWFFTDEQDLAAGEIFYVPCEGGVGGLYDAWGGNDREEKYWRAIERKKPLIVPPVIDKTLFHKSECLQHVRCLARKAVQAADRIVCMGYSLPAGDKDMCDLLSETTETVDAEQKTIPFDIVNPTDLVPHFSGVLNSPRYRFSHFADFSHDCIARYVVNQGIPQPEIARYVARMTLWNSSEFSAK